MSLKIAMLLVFAAASWAAYHVGYMHAFDDMAKVMCTREGSDVQSYSLKPVKPGYGL